MRSRVSRVSRACESFHDNSVTTLSRLSSSAGAQSQPSLAVIFCKRGSSCGIGFPVNHCGRHAGKGHQRTALGEIEIVPIGIETASPISILRRRARNYRDRWPATLSCGIYTNEYLLHKRNSISTFNWIFWISSCFDFYLQWTLLQFS